MLRKLAPHLVAEHGGVLYPRDSHRKGDEHESSAVEFSQVTRALNIVDTSRDALKSRTDLAHVQRFAFATASGRGSDFPAAFVAH